MKLTYLDNNATTQVDPEVIKAMLPYFGEKYANASGVYSFAQEIKKEMEAAREVVAKFIGATPAEIIFTGCGTESDNMAIKGVAYANKDKGNHIITSVIEHHAVLNALKYLEKQGFEVTYLPVDKYGIVQPEELKKAMRKETILVTIMHANNEIGTIEPIEELAKIAKEAGVYFHTDAVQTAGKIPLDVNKLGVDLLSISAHKLYGPKGVGVLYVRKGVRMHSLLQGGHHEKNRRAGTENVAGIVGLAKACELADADLKSGKYEAQVKKLRDRLEKGLTEAIPETIVNGHPDKRIFNTSNIVFKYIEGESVLINLDFEGIAASSGSACTSGSLEPSHVLLATGLPHGIAHGSIRFSFSKFNTEADVDLVIKVLPPVIAKLRELSPFWHERENMMKDTDMNPHKHGSHGHHEGE
jgi:cysteine desulfurase